MYVEKKKKSVKNQSTTVTNCKTMATTLAEKLIEKIDRYTNFEIKFDKNFRIVKTVIFCTIEDD